MAGAANDGQTAPMRQRAVRAARRNRFRCRWTGRCRRARTRSTYLSNGAWRPAGCRPRNRLLGGGVVVTVLAVFTTVGRFALAVCPRSAAAVCPLAACLVALCLTVACRTPRLDSW